MPAKEVEALKRAVKAAQVIVRKPVIDLDLPDADPQRRRDEELRQIGRG